MYINVTQKMKKKIKKKETKKGISKEIGTDGLSGRKEEKSLIGTKSW